MDDMNMLLSIMELMQGVNNSSQFQQLQHALNSIGTDYSFRIKTQTIDDGINSCKDIIHSIITNSPYRVEQVREADKNACTAFCESLKTDYKKIFRDYGELIEE